MAEGEGEAWHKGVGEAAMWHGGVGRRERTACSVPVMQKSTAASENVTARPRARSAASDDGDDDLPSRPPPAALPLPL